MQGLLFFFFWFLCCIQSTYEEIGIRSTGTNVLATSAAGDFFATGSAAGVVNVYDGKVARNSRNAKPLKALMNITTPISNLVFNFDSQILAAASRSKGDTLKMVCFCLLFLFSTCSHLVNDPSFICHLQLLSKIGPPTRRRCTLCRRWTLARIPATLRSATTRVACSCIDCIIIHHHKSLY